MEPTKIGRPEVPGTDLAARYVTGSGNVGGDWYDVFVLPDGKLGVVVGDVAWGGNWFFLIKEHSFEAARHLSPGNVEHLTAFTWEVRRALNASGITGSNGEEILLKVLPSLLSSSGHGS